MPILLGALFLLSSIVPACAQAAQPSRGPVRAPHVSAQLVSAEETVAPGGTFQAGLYFKLEKGWHVYWQNPGDSGDAPRVRWTLPSTVVAGEVHWPVPKRIALGPLVNYGYEDEVLLPIPMRVSANAGAGQVLALEADVHWLVCKEECVPGQAVLMHAVIARPGASEMDGEWAPMFGAAARMLPMPLPAGARATGYRSPEGWKLQLNGVTGVSSFLDFFPQSADLVANAALPEAELSGSALKLKLKPSDRAPATSPAKLSGVALFGLPEGGTRAYSTDFMLGMPMGEGMMGILLPILFAFLGGLILNLMPCVFPVLSIKIVSVLKMSSGERRHMIGLGWAYTLGILVSFWVLVAALLAIRYGGRQIGWGFQLQSPAFVFLMACLLFGFALNLLGLFEISGRFMGLGGSLSAREGMAGSFFTGVLATLVATPCTAPFMGSAIGYALAQPAPVVFVVFTSLALGLAAPYLLVSYFPVIGRILPRPGRWMETFKQAMAFPLFLAVLWLAWVLGLQTSSTGVLWLIGAFMGIGFAVWLASRWTRLGGVALALGIAASVWGAAAARQIRPPELAASASPSATTENGLNWEKFSPARVAELRAAGRPIFIDFTAAWCVACQVNELAVFGSAEVRAKLKELGFALLKADWTNEDPVVTEALASFGRSGVPFYVIYGKGKDSPATPLPEVINAGIVLTELEKIK